MVVEAFRRDSDLPRCAWPVLLGYEEGIPVRRWVIDDQPPVRRPVELRDVRDVLQERPEHSAQRRNRPRRIDFAAPGGVGDAPPQRDVRTVRIEAQSPGGGIPQLRHAAPGEIVGSSGAHLAHPRIPRSVAIGQKGHELSVARDRRVVVRPSGFRQPGDDSPFERAPPEVFRSLQLPPGRRGERQQRRCAGSPPGASDSRGGDRRHDYRRARRDDRAFEHFVDLETRVADIAQSTFRILIEAAQQQPADGGRCDRRQQAPVGVVFEDGGDRVGTGFAAKWRPSRQHFVEHAPERPDVGPLVDRLPTGLLGTHVGGRPLDQPLA